MWEEINMSCPLGLLVYVLWASIIIRFCLYLTDTVQRVMALEASYYFSVISISREEFEDGSRLPNSYEHDILACTS